MFDTHNVIAYGPDAEHRSWNYNYVNILVRQSKNVNGDMKTTRTWFHVFHHSFRWQ